MEDNIFDDLVFLVGVANDPTNVAGLKRVLRDIYKGKDGKACRIMDQAFRELFREFDAYRSLMRLLDAESEEAKRYTSMMTLNVESVEAAWTAIAWMIKKTQEECDALASKCREADGANDDQGAQQ